jgi:hypothetical protein
MPAAAGSAAVACGSPSPLAAAVSLQPQPKLVFLNTTNLSGKAVMHCIGMICGVQPVCPDVAALNIQYHTLYFECISSCLCW